MAYGAYEGEGGYTGAGSPAAGGQQGWQGDDGGPNPLTYPDARNLGYRRALAFNVEEAARIAAIQAEQDEINQKIDAFMRAANRQYWSERPEEDAKIKASNAEALAKAQNYPTDPTGLNFIDQLISSVGRNPMEAFAKTSPTFNLFKAAGDAINRAKGIETYEEAYDPFMEQWDPNENDAWKWMIDQEQAEPEGTPPDDALGISYPTLPTDYTPAFGDLERARYLEKVYNDMLANTTRPEGLSEQEFGDILSNRMALRDVRAGEGADQMAMENWFGSPNLGQMFLDEETRDRRAGFTDALGGVFTGDAFQPVDDSIISAILDERQGAAQQQVGRFGQRGNLNPAGAETASRNIIGQREGATTRLGEISDVVGQRNIRDLEGIKDRATSAIAGYDLGEELFDVEPYRAERGQLIGEREASLGEDIRSTLGGEPLYDISGAIRSATGSQGVVAGPQATLLDTIASRGTGSGRYKPRGLGSAGVF
jgi:hypothetical protein